MTDSPVIFRPIADGRELVLLGMIPVGEIAPGHVERVLLAPAAAAVSGDGSRVRAFSPDDCGKIKQAVRP